MRTASNSSTEDRWDPWEEEEEEEEEEAWHEFKVRHLPVSSDVAPRRGK